MDCTWKLRLERNRSDQPRYARLVVYRRVGDVVIPHGVRWLEGEDPVVVDLRWDQIKRDR
jgi:hypothetical protein